MTNKYRYVRIGLLFSRQYLLWDLAFYTGATAVILIIVQMQNFIKKYSILSTSLPVTHIISGSCYHYFLSWFTISDKTEVYF